MIHEQPAQETLELCRTALHRLAAELAGASSRRDRSRRAQVERALSWLGSGYYGRCGVCDRRIADEHLRANPEQLVCDRCCRLAGSRGRAPAREPTTVLAAW
ncbi:MAG: hypothetical protein K1X88_36080 [Nannocystaceae bacterium]|nr:hypothetical protein [Nannocystaceae bacterium]